MSRVLCPRCHGRGYVIVDHGDSMGPADCPLACEMGFHSLPLCARVALLDLESRGQLADYYAPEGVPDLDEVEAATLRGFWWNFRPETA